MKRVGVNTYQSYVDEGFEYAVVQSGRYESWFRRGENLRQKYPGFGEFYYELFERGLLVEEFDPRDGNRPGPVVKVFALR